MPRQPDVVVADRLRLIPANARLVGISLVPGLFRIDVKDNTYEIIAHEA